MTRIHARARRGATLIELLVVLAIIAALGALALMIAPGIANQDNTLKGTAEVQASLKIAQGMAAAARQPRGLRLIAPTNGSNVTEMLYLESPAVLVADPRVLSATDSFGTARPSPAPFGVNWPYVEFIYEMYNGGEAPLANSQWTLPGNPTANAIKQRTCSIIGLTLEQELDVVDSSTLVLPTLSAFSRVVGTPTVTVATATSPRKLNVELEVYPDAALGAGTAYRTYHFGIYGAPRPLLGEPTIQLPKNIAVDLEMCSPRAQPVTPSATPVAPWRDYDILFAPSGHVLSSTTRQAGGQLFLWVRDSTKVASMTPTIQAPLTFNPQQFRQGGEQQIVGIRGAAIGTAPVLWPDMTAGTYALGQNPFTFARQKLTGQ